MNLKLSRISLDYILIEDIQNKSSDSIEIQDLEMYLNTLGFEPKKKTMIISKLYEFKSVLLLEGNAYLEKYKPVIKFDYSNTSNISNIEIAQNSIDNAYEEIKRSI